MESIYELFIMKLFIYKNKNRTEHKFGKIRMINSNYYKILIVRGNYLINNNEI